MEEREHEGEKEKENKINQDHSMGKHFSMTPTHNTAVCKMHEHLPALHELDTNTQKTERLHLPGGEQTAGQQ